MTRGGTTYQQKVPRKKTEARGEPPEAPSAPVASPPPSPPPMPAPAEEPVPVDRATMPAHPLADLFPLIEGAEFEELVADIRANGLRVPIVTIEGDAGPVILDGRNRYRACVEAGVEPRFERYEGDDPAGFVAAANLLRRHLSTHDRQVLAGKFATMPHGGDRKADQGADRPLDPAKPAMTVERAADVFGVSERTVKRARKVEQDASPALKKRFHSGEVSVDAAAEIAKAPAPVQEAIAALPPETMKVAARVIKKDPEVVRSAQNAICGKTADRRRRLTGRRPRRADLSGERRKTKRPRPYIRGETFGGSDAFARDGIT